MFVDKTDDWNRSEGGERHVRSVSEVCWISVLHRLTGFGHMEWETAICIADIETRQHVEGSPFIVRGDWRDELAELPESELLNWYASKSGEHPTSFEAVMRLLKSAQ